MNARREHVAANDNGPRAYGRPRILVAEDDTFMRELVVGALTRDGYDVLEATDGQAAIQTLEDLTVREWSAEPVDLLLSDVRMGVTSGLALAGMLRSAHSPMPVILMTAFPDASVEREAERLEVTLLAKPFRLDILRRMVIVTLAARSRARHEQEAP